MTPIAVIKPLDAKTSVVDYYKTKFIIQQLQYDKYVNTFFCSLKMGQASPSLVVQPYVSGVARDDPLPGHQVGMQANAQAWLHHCYMYDC